MKHNNRSNLIGAAIVLLFGVVMFGGYTWWLYHQVDATHSAQASASNIYPTTMAPEQPVRVRQMGSVTVEVYYDMYGTYVYICREGDKIVPCAAH